MSDTPRTDAYLQAWLDSGIGGKFEPVALCRQLERENADLRARLEQTEEVVDAARELLALKAKKDLYRQLNDNGDRAHSWGLEFELEYQRKKPMLWKALADALCALSPTEESK